ncbi:MAG: type II toxin-antitoxin system RelE/ParE family toxin [Deltaproteobacteria bacterium]|nr:type II toxin-antitoxin system RelE/ParE family toxin [Deltaproteobacteria bacterium]
MQNNKVAWLRLALADLHDIGSYLAEHDPAAARDVAQHIWKAGQSLAAAPSRGRPGRAPGTRELVLTRYPYFLAYRVSKQDVQIMRVLHTSRQYPS